MIQGNMLTIPLAGNRVIFVEPIYLKATTSEMPELKRVVVSNGFSIGYASTFEEALADFLGAPGMYASEINVTSESESQEDLIAEAGRHFQEYQRLYGEGRFTEAGQHLEKLGSILNRLSD